MFVETSVPALIPEVEALLVAFDGFHCDRWTDEFTKPHVKTTQDIHATYDTLRTGTAFIKQGAGNRATTVPVIHITCGGGCLSQLSPVVEWEVPNASRIRDVGLYNHGSVPFATGALAEIAAAVLAGGPPDHTLEPPSRPRGLSEPHTICQSDGKVTATLEWQPATGADGYWVDLSLLNNGFKSGTFLAQPAGGGGSSQFTWSNLAPGRHHYWRVGAYKSTPDAMIWSHSDTAEFDTPKCLPTPPQSLSVSPVTCQPDGRVTANFHWQAVDWADGYWLDLTLDPQFERFLNVHAGSGGTSQYTWIGLKPDTTHYWRLWAYRHSPDGTIGAQSEIASFVTPDCATAPPPAKATNVFKGWEVSACKGPRFDDCTEKTGTFAPDDGAIMVRPVFEHCTAGREWYVRLFQPSGRLDFVGHGIGAEDERSCTDNADFFLAENAACFPGTWTKEVEMEGQTYSTTFEVDRAPPMELVSTDVGYGFDQNTGVVSGRVAQVTRPGTVYFVQRWRYWCGPHSLKYTLGGGGTTVDTDEIVLNPYESLPRRLDPIPDTMWGFFTQRYPGLNWTWWSLDFTASDLARWRGALTVVTKIDGAPRATQSIALGR